MIFINNSGNVNHLKRLFLLLVLLLFSKFLLAQNPLLKNYTTNDGLPSYEVYMAMQDHNGYMWFATNYGVCRFDGYRFESFDMKDGLTDNTVFELYEDSIGRIWFITCDFKLSYWYKNKIYKYRYNDNISKAVDVKPYIENRSFYIDGNDNIYFSIYTKGAFVINRNGVVRPFKNELTKNNKVVLVSVAPKKYIVSYPYLKDCKVYYEYKGSLYYVGLDTLNSFVTRMNLVSSQGILYFTQDNYVFKIRGSNYQTYKVSDFIISLDEDKMGNIWVGLRNNGALCYLKGDFSHPPIFHVLKGKPVSSIISDRENGLWFTTTTSGVFYTPSLLFSSFTQSEGLPDNNVKMTTICPDSSVIVITSGNSYNMIKDDTCIHVNTEISNAEDILFASVFDNITWIGTNLHIYKIENGITKKINGNLTIEYIYPASKEDLYICTKTNIGKVSNDSVLVLPSSIAFMRFVNICSSPDGKMYFSSYYGAGEIRNDSLIMLSEKFPRLKLRSTWVLCNPMDTSLWIATKGEGIYILQNGKVTQLDISNGLSSNNVKHMALGKDEIWVSTNNGISRILLNKTKQWSVQRINTDNGLISNDINQITVSNDTIYVATDKGLTIFNYNKVDNNLPQNFNVLLTGIKINERDTSVLTIYQLPYNTATILISFGYMSFINAGKMNYMYRIKGLSDKWNYTKSTEIRLTTLPPGEYTLEIYALFDDNDKCRFPASVTFVIHPPYWEKWWFILLVSLFLISIIAGGYFYRIRQINRRNHLKYQMLEYQRQALNSQMNPHFIFNSLNSIQLYILKNDIRTSNKYLTKFSSLMRSVLINSNKPSITLEEEINTIMTYIELEALRFDNKFDHRITVDESLNKAIICIPTLLIQPFVENAIWHGLMNKIEKGLLTISILPEENNCIKCIICDDGVGRKKAAEINESKQSAHKSLGAKITQERLDLHNTLYHKNLRIKFIDLYDDSGQPAGTTVELIIPIIT